MGGVRFPLVRGPLDFNPLCGRAVRGWVGFWHLTAESENLLDEAKTEIEKLQVKFFFVGEVPAFISRCFTVFFLLIS